MPRRKITLEDAYAVFEQHGVPESAIRKVVAEQQNTAQAEPLSAFLEDSTAEENPVAKQVSYRKVKITLRAAHTISKGGYLKEVNGEQVIEGNSVETYGPGVITVDSRLAEQLLHQDMLAIRADERMLDRTFRSYVLVPSAQGANSAICVSEDSNFDIAGFVNRMADMNFQGLRGIRRL